MSVVIETTLGDITIDLYLSDRPRACLNFLKLCKKKYYNYNLFHTISRGFIAQTGDPTGTRNGGESLYGLLDGPEKRYFEAEDEPRIKHTKMGLISFVGNEERMIGSQFFLTLGENLTYLDEKHCVFGEVVEGFDILEHINEVICDTDDRPYQDVRITHTVILDDPYPDPRRFKVPSRSPSPSAERFQGGRIAPDEDINETEGKTNHEVAEMQAEQEAKARATILEMVGDLPDAEMAPPENVLFVCKLNPVTTDDDLEIIFNRFGKIVSCEVIRDRKTGDSLQYAFIEFSDRKSCENAYFKMDNILIDDRRIHVDFSQSVSKVKWLGKGRGVAHFDDQGRNTVKTNNDIGKGNYKINRRYNSYSPDQTKNSKSRKNQENHQDSGKSSNPQTDVKETNLRRVIDEKERNRYPRKYEQHRSRTISSRERRYRSRSRSRSVTKMVDSRKKRNRNRSRSRSVTKIVESRRNKSRDRYRNRREGSFNVRSDGRNRRMSRSRSPHTKNDRDRDNSRYSKNGSPAIKNAQRSYNNEPTFKSTIKRVKHDNISSKRNKSTDRIIKNQTKHKINDKKKEKSDSDSDKESIEDKTIQKNKMHATNSSEEDKKSEKRNSKQKTLKKVSKKKEYSTTESESESSATSSDTEEENIKQKTKKSLKIKKNKRSIRKKSTDSDSSDSSDSSNSKSSSSESEDKKKRKKRRKRTKESSSSTYSSDSDVSRSKKSKIRRK